MYSANKTQVQKKTGENRHAHRYQELQAAHMEMQRATGNTPHVGAAKGVPPAKVTAYRATIKTQEEVRNRRNLTQSITHA